jgi:hypothetical protein
LKQPVIIISETPISLRLLMHRRHFSIADYAKSAILRLGTNSGIWYTVVNSIQLFVSVTQKNPIFTGQIIDKIFRYFDLKKSLARIYT